MHRHCSNWLASYEEYVANTESPQELHRWVGLSSIAAVLRKKVYFALGRILVYPNIYCVLVGPPAVKKSVAIKFGKDLLAKIPDIHLSSDATTPEAFIQDLAGAVATEQMPDGRIFVHCSLSVISRELEVFLGQKITNTKMLVLLTDLFDSPEDDWKYRTKHGKSDVIPSVFLNILAATTPDSLASSLPLSAVGSGLISRIIFVYSDKRGKKVPIPELGEEDKKLEAALLEDLFIMSRLAGVYQFSPEAREYWIAWYNNFEGQNPSRICLDPTFSYWYERKPTQVLKIAQLIAASKTNELIITPEYLELAISYIGSVEPAMGKAFSGVGRSTISAELEMVAHALRTEGKLSEPNLVSRFLKEMDNVVFDNVIKTLIRSGQVRRQYGTPNQPDYYHWVGEIDV
jgi:hypothetical protein